MGNLFSYNVDIRKNAYLNWRTENDKPAHNLQILASDYADGAVVLINTILQDNVDKKADSLIMPILYSIDQAIELYLKAIIRLIEEQSAEQILNYRTHDILKLKNQMVEKMEKVEVGIDELDKHMKPVTDFINELYIKIKGKSKNGKDVVNIDFARYPFKTNGESHFYVSTPENVVIDVENLKKRFIDIRDALEALYLFYDNKN